MKSYVRVATAVVAVCLGVGALRADEEAVQQARQRLLEAQQQFQKAIAEQAHEAMKHAREGNKSGHQAQAQAQGRIVIIGPDGKQTVREFSPHSGVVELSAGEWSEFIIGVGLRGVPEGFHGLMGVENGVGVLVAEVLPDSPAQQAGIQRFDLILSVNGEPVHSPEQLQKMIGKAGEQELTLQVRRNQDAVEIKVTPKKNDLPRPEVPGIVSGTVPPVVAPGNPLHLRWLGPGVVTTPTPGAETEALKDQLKALNQKLQEQQEQLKDLMEAVKQLKSEK